VIYPDSQAEMMRKGWRDEDLLEVLHIVHLAHILAREGGWDVAADWKVLLHLLIKDYRESLISKYNVYSSWTEGATVSMAIGQTLSRTDF
jgi:hypothetical protein